MSIPSLFGKVSPAARFTQSARETFTPLVKRAFALFVADRVSNRLRQALAQEDEVTGRLPPSEMEPGETPSPEASVDEIVTTEEELEGFRIVRAIVCSVLPRARIVHRDAKTYFAILCDDNNRKPICRLHFNRAQKYIGLFDANKVETRHPLGDVDELYGYAEQLREAAQRYL